MIRNSSTASGLRSIEKISKRALATILVPQCACCRQAHHLPSRLCAVCLASLRSTLCPRSMRFPRDFAGDHAKIRDRIGMTEFHNAAGIRQLQSIFFYRDVVPDLLIRWKYDGMVELTNLIASWVANHCQISASYDLATIVPCHWRRRLTRGFDHMWLLANALAKIGLIEPPTKTLKHSKPLPFLHLQEATDRHIDPDHFHAVCSVKGKRILIIDDVITSGTTLRAAAGALKRDGAAEVSALTVATARELLLPTSRTRV
jgi:ComF family protein